MYETFFGFHRRPFLAVPDTESYFSVAAMEESRQTIERTVRRGEGISLVLGPSGTGKTLLLRMLRKTLEVEYTVATITNGHLETPRAFFQQLLYELRLPFSNAEETELRLMLLDFARQETTPGVVLLIDESQFLSQSVLEEIRLMMNSDDGAIPYFRPVLAGTVELEEHLTHPRLEAFNQRVVTRCYLDSFAREETVRYITAQLDFSRNRSADDSDGRAESLRLSTSGDNRRLDRPHIKPSETIFTENAKRRVHGLTDGLPRLINQLCDNAMQLAAEQARREIDDAMIGSAWSKLQRLDEEAIEAATPNTPEPVEDIEEIVARKKTTFRLREFKSTVQFGSLDDSTAISAEETTGALDDSEDAVNVSLPDDDDVPEQQSDEEQSTGAMVLRAIRSGPTENLPEERYKPPYPEDDTEDGEEEAGESGEFEKTAAVAGKPETASCDSATEKIVAELEETDTAPPPAGNEREDDLEALDEIIGNEILFSSDGMDFAVADSGDDSAEMIESFDMNDIPRAAETVLVSDDRATPHEPIVFGPVVSEPAVSVTIVDNTTTQSSQELPMDQETLEKYGKEVLQGRPPFIRKEPNYAYRTTEPAPEKRESVSYPDPATGHVIRLNWSAPEHRVVSGIGTVYREFAARDDSDRCPTSPDDNPGDRATPAATPDGESNSDHIVRASLESSESSAVSYRACLPGKSAWEESFDEIVALEAKTVSVEEVYVAGLRIGLAPPGTLSNDEIIDRRLEQVVRRITAAAEKIEQAAVVSEDAGHHVKETAVFIEKEVQAALPTYVDMFRELSNFQRTISDELRIMQGKTPLPVPEVGETAVPNDNRCEKLLPFPRRPDFVPQETESKPSEERHDDVQKEQSIDVRTLFL